MSESRTPQKIQEEYQQLAFKAGNIQYQIACAQDDLKVLNGQLKDLNFEFLKASEAEKDKKAAEALKEAP